MNYMDAICYMLMVANGGMYGVNMALGNYLLATMSAFSVGFIIAIQMAITINEIMKGSS